MASQNHIVLNEVLNDGSSIFLYPDKESGCCIAYGYSAYLLSLLDGQIFHAAFSTEHQMPFITMTETVFQTILLSSDLSIKPYKDGYLGKSGSIVDEDRYRIWVQCLKLKSLLSQCEEARTDADFSLSAVLSQSKINISMYRLVSTYGLDEEFGTSLYFSRRGRCLFKTLEERLRVSKTITNRARIILAMYRLNHETSAVYDQDSDEICADAVKTLFRHASHSLIPLSDLESALVCQCIAHYLYYIEEYDGLQRQMRNYFDTNISSWMSHDWVCDFSPRVIMVRIGALVCNSDMFMDTRYDENISGLTAYLCNKMDNLTADERIELYSLVSDQGSAAFDPSAAERLLKFDYPVDSRHESRYMKVDGMCRFIENCFA